MRNPNDEEREPTNHANRREKKSEAEITGPFRMFGVFRGQIAFIRVNRCAGRGRATPAGRTHHECRSNPKRSCFANGTIMDAYAHTPFAATDFLSNGCSSDLQKAAKETKIFFSTSALKRSLGIAGVFRSR